MKTRFISMAKARRILGKDAHNLSDDQIQELLNILYGCAEYCYCDWAQDLSGLVD